MIGTGSLAPAEEVERRDACREAPRKGVAWFVRQLNPDGSIPDPRARLTGDRAPSTLTVDRETEAGLHWKPAW